MHNLYIITARDWPRIYIEEASTLALYEFVEKGVLKKISAQRFPGEPINRNAKFVMTKNKAAIAVGINCMITAGYGAGISGSELEKLRKRAERG